MKRLLGAIALVAAAVLPAAPAHAAEDPDAYMNTVAGQLGEPGVWVDPDVDGLTASEAAELDRAAKAAGAPMRIAVIPAARINVAKSTYYSTPAWEGEEIADQLYDRVGVEGVYAVLVDATSESKGRGFHAVQRADHGPTYHVGDAVDQAVDCCAPDYEDMLVRFIERAQDVDKPFYVDAAPYAGGVAGVIGLWWGLTALGARRTRRKDEKEHLERHPAAAERGDHRAVAAGLRVADDVRPAAVQALQGRPRHGREGAAPAGRGQRGQRHRGGDHAARICPLRTGLPRGGSRRASRSRSRRRRASSTRGTGPVRPRSSGSRSGGASREVVRLRGLQAAGRRRGGAPGPDGGAVERPPAAVLDGRRGPGRVHRRLLVAG